MEPIYPGAHPTPAAKFEPTFAPPNSFGCIKHAHGPYFSEQGHSRKSFLSADVYASDNSMGCNIVKRIPRAGYRMVGIAIRKAQIDLITRKERYLWRCWSEKIQSKSVITPRSFFYQCISHLLCSKKIFHKSFTLSIPSVTNVRPKE